MVAQICVFLLTSLFAEPLKKNFVISIMVLAEFCTGYTYPILFHSGSCNQVKFLNWCFKFLDNKWCLPWFIKYNIGYWRISPTCDWRILFQLFNDNDKIVILILCLIILSVIVIINVSFNKMLNKFHLCYEFFILGADS